MSKDLFHIIRERDMLRDSRREPLDTHLRTLHLRNYRQIRETTKLKTK